MKSSFLTLILIIFQLSYFTSGEYVSNQDDSRIETNQMKITIGSTIFTATLLDNETVTAFKEMLPITLDMNELNGNEKYARLSSNLPTNAQNPGTIHAGDLMLWGSNTFVLFYETLSTSYNYTRIGRIENSSGLADAVGLGSVAVTFELE